MVSNHLIRIYVINSFPTITFLYSIPEANDLGKYLCLLHYKYGRRVSTHAWNRKIDNFIESVVERRRWVNVKLLPKIFLFSNRSAYPTQIDVFFRNAVFPSLSRLLNPVPCSASLLIWEPKHVPF